MWFNFEISSIIKYMPLQEYWNSETNSFIYSVDQKYVCLTAKGE